MSRSTGGFRRSDRLLLSRDFQRVARHGTRIAAGDLVMLVAPARAVPRERGDTRRLGVTASRKVGPAVQRNRLKRGIREWFRHSRGNFEDNVDVVVIARPGAAELAGEELRAQLGVLLGKLQPEPGSSGG
ncbi:MAG: ribonuclease P protein component [Myxococcota bacterium]|nr:ribonuclease P protein component [Myxococcota bacterium]